MTRNRGDDRGQVGGIEVLPFGLLVFVVGTLLIANTWAVIDAKLAVDAAARQAARHFVEADVPAARDFGDAEAAARRAGYEALAAHGREEARSTVELTALESPDGQAGFSRCARATFTASYDVPVLHLPWIGGFGSGLDVTSSHSELIDPYRDGVPGSAEACS
ncbi:MAG TPA: hypothetical protein VIZ67_12440 [Acidimicrobiales bacterium]